MNVIRLNSMPSGREFVPSVMALGNFDGVHIGHKQIIRVAEELARQKDVALSLMTFSPHPKQVLGRDSKYERLLTPLSAKIDLFARLQVDILYIVTFDRAFAAMLPEQFVQHYVKALAACDVVVGFDFSFGRGGKANTEALQRLASAHGIGTHVVPPVQWQGDKVSSSFIRELLQKGNVQTAAQLLGRPYQLTGRVIHGDQRGRTLGFPTANLELTEDFVLPRYGVYLVHVWLEGENRPYAGLMNIGVRPTVSGEKILSLEVHVLDVSRDLYGQSLKIEFLDFLREEKKFPSVQELQKQMQQDLLTARQRLVYLP